MMHCNGKCQMLKKMKKQESDNSSGANAPKYNQPDFVFSSKSFFPSIEFIFIQKANKYFSYNTVFTVNYAGAIFHPPCISIC